MMLSNTQKKKHLFFFLLMRLRHLMCNKKTEKIENRVFKVEIIFDA